MNAKEIILCHQCNGIGITYESIRVNAYESDSIERPCYLCKGSGRLLKITIIEPYKPVKE